MPLIAHRANDNHKFLENTKEAVLHCLSKDYIDGIEIDVRITKDKKIVVIHDLIVDLLSNGNGFVKDKSLKELKQYTFGKNQTIATLEEILKIMNHKLLLIEVKEISNDFKQVSKIIYKIIKKFPHLNIIICSFNYELLNYLKTLDNNIKCGLIISFLINSDKIHNDLDYNLLNISQLKKVRDQDFIWTINNQDNYKKVKNQNNKAMIVTDIPYKLSEL